jgi:hypothetical protein
MRKGLFEWFASIRCTAERVTDFVQKRAKETLGLGELVALDYDRAIRLVPDAYRLVVAVRVQAHRSRDSDLIDALSLLAEELEQRRGELKHPSLTIAQLVDRDEVVLEATVPLIAILTEVAERVAFEVLESR